MIMYLLRKYSSLEDHEIDSILNYLNLNMPFDSTIKSVLKNKGLDYLSPDTHTSSQQSQSTDKIKNNTITKNINETKNESNSKQPTMKNIIHPFVKRHVIKNIKKELIGQTIKVGGWQKTLRQTGESF